MGKDTKRSDVGKVLRYVELKRYDDPGAEAYYADNDLEKTCWKFSKSEPDKGSYNWILAGCSAGILHHHPNGDRIEHYRGSLNWVLVTLNAKNGIPGSRRRMFEGEGGLSSYFGASVCGPWAVQDTPGIPPVEGVREWLRSVFMTYHLFVVPGQNSTNRLFDPCVIPGCRFVNLGDIKNESRWGRESYILRCGVVDPKGDRAVYDDHSTSMIARIGRPVLNDEDIKIANRTTNQGTPEAFREHGDLVNSLGVGLRPGIVIRYQRNGDVATGFLENDGGNGPTHPPTAIVSTEGGVQSCYGVDKTLAGGEKMGQQSAAVEDGSVFLSVRGSSATTSTQVADLPPKSVVELFFDDSGVRLVGDDGPDPDPDPPKPPTHPTEKQECQWMRIHRRIGDLHPKVIPTFVPNPGDPENGHLVAMTPGGNRFALPEIEGVRGPK